jgi:uncharacterized repeat protein (TIGR02543 family)
MNTQMPLVAFQSDGKTVNRQQVPNGKTLAKPADPVRSGYTFNGWYNGNTAWNFNTGVTNSMVLTANWTSDDNPIVPIVLPKVSHSNALSVMQNSLTLQVQGGGAAVQIFDLKGNLVRSLRYADGNYVIPLGDLPKGLYIAKASNASWQQTVKVNVIK